MTTMTVKDLTQVIGDILNRIDALEERINRPIFVDDIDELPACPDCGAEVEYDEYDSHRFACSAMCTHSPVAYGRTKEIAGKRWIAMVSIKE